MGMITTKKRTEEDGLTRLRALAAEPPLELVAARQRVADARQRERKAQEALDSANGLQGNPPRRRLAQEDAAATVYDARAARERAEQ